MIITWLQVSLISALLQVESSTQSTLLVLISKTMMIVMMLYAIVDNDGDVHDNDNN